MAQWIERILKCAFAGVFQKSLEKSLTLYNLGGIIMTQARRKTPKIGKNAGCRVVGGNVSRPGGRHSLGLSKEKIDRHHIKSRHRGRATRGQPIHINQGAPLPLWAGFLLRTLIY